MEVSLDLPDVRHFVRAYQPGFLTLNDQTHARSILLMPNQVISDWPPQSFSDLKEEHIEILLMQQPVELILLGTGKTQHFLSPKWTALCHQNHIGLETMRTDAACRTYNLLAAEGRKVLAALLII